MPLLPALIQGFNTTTQSATSLQRIPLDTPPYNEDWLQNLIHHHPELVPAGEVEACFANIVPVLREFWLHDGYRDNYLDNFFITPDGYPVLVEVKLWKNQEARREVVVQILNYAKEFAARSYEDINKEIRRQHRGRAWGANPLHEIVAAYTPDTPDESTFVDRVSRNLREGRFLLLILGDGVREEMANLAQFLLHHSLRYAFGIVQVTLFKLPDGSFLSLPSVLAKTQTIERHVTVIIAQNGGITVSTPTTVVSEKVQKTSLSLDGFYEHMAEKNPQNVAWTKDVLERLSGLPIEPEIGSKGETLMLKMTMPGGERLQFMLITPETAEFWGIPTKEWKNPAWQKLSLAYLERIAALVPGASVQIFNSGANVKQGGKALRLQHLHDKSTEVAEAIKSITRDAEAFYASAGRGIV